jgi:hypothetical protein
VVKIAVFCGVAPDRRDVDKKCAFWRIMYSLARSVFGCRIRSAGIRSVAFLLGVQSVIFFVALGQAGRCCLCVLFVKWHTLALGVVFFGRALMG